MQSTRMLISLHRGYGLGDAVQVSAVLRHVAKYRPNWIVDYQAEDGKHVVGRGIVNSTFAYGNQPQDVHYDAEILLCLYDSWANWHDRPNTRVSSCLHEVFGLPWDAECGRYQLNTPLVLGLSAGEMVPDRAVAIHYQGDSSPAQKNLTNEQANAICSYVERLGYRPQVMDWRKQSPLPYEKIMGTNGHRADVVYSIIEQCEAFIGIDSGPGKCASATDTPALIIWTGHHPAPFHDPAPNTTHLVPAGYHGLEPVCNDRGVIDWFERHYSVREYHDGNPVLEVQRWLGQVLK